MEKTLRDKILKKTIEDLNLPEEVVEKVVSWSYKKANEATKTNSEVEISGLGIFKTSPAKIKRRVARIETILMKLSNGINEGRSKNVTKDYIKIEACMDNINYCNSKIKDGSI